MKYSRWLLCREAPGLNRNLKGLTEVGSAPALPQAPCLNMGRAVLQGVSSQSSPKNVGVDPPLSFGLRSV